MSKEKGKTLSSDSKPSTGGQTEVKKGVVKGNTLPTYQAPPPPPPKEKK